MDAGQQKKIVVDFLTRCNAYADDKLREYRRRLDGTTSSEALALQDKIGHWTAYRAFNEFTIEELKSEALDDWFRH